MKRVALALALTAGLVVPATVHAGTVFGVTEDAGKYSSDGGAAFFSRLRDLGMTENAVSVQWDPDRPTVIVERALLDRLVANASRFRIRIVFAVYFTRPNAVTSRPSGAEEFAAFLRVLARAYPQVKDFVVGNEPNYGVFWQPQFGHDGTPVAGAAYEDLLARSYDALKSVDPRINVIGLGLAARGNDLPGSSAPSTSPVLFLRDVGAAYRRSGRNRPLMDSLAYHPYPASSLDAAGTKQPWPQAGVADLGRLKQAVWDAFHDTAQATFETGLALKITEVGWQAAIPSAVLGAYRGAENVRTTDEVSQARIYAQLVRDLACDPAVTDVLFFHLVDEAELGGFQSGLIRADGTPRPSYAAVQRAIAEKGGRCTGGLQAWRHAEDVVGGSVEFADPAVSGLGFSASAQEGATYRAGIFRVDGSPTRVEQEALEHSLVRAGSNAVTGSVSVSRRMAFPLEAPTEPGLYVQAVLLSAATEPSRRSLFLSEPFTVGSQALDVIPPEGKFSVVAGETKGSFAVAETTSPAIAAFRQAKRRAKAGTGPTKASFRSLTQRSNRLPGAADVGPAGAAGTSAPKPSHSAPSTKARISLDSRKPKSMIPHLFALLLVGSAISAVLAIRLLGR